VIDPPPDFWCWFFYGDGGGTFCALFYHRPDPDFKQNSGEVIKEKSGAEGNEILSNNGLSSKFPLSEPFDFDEHDIRKVLQDADLI